METAVPVPERVFRLAVAPVERVVVRDASGTGDGSWTIEGYAAVFEQETVLFDSRFWRMREVIARGAFTRVLGESPLVHLNFGHDMNTSVAATDVRGVGGLELEEDFHGLRFFARVDPDDPDAVRLATKMRRGVVKQASFAFTIAREELAEAVVDENGKEDELYRILEIGELYDVCACPQGAYPQTESHLRGLAAASLGRTGFDPVGLDRRSEPDQGEEGVTDVASGEEPGGEGDPARRHRLAQLRAQAAVLAHRHPRR